MLPPAGLRHRDGSQCSDKVFSATESAYSESLKHCQSGFGNVGTAFAAVATVAAALATAAAVLVTAAAAECIPLCFVVGHWWCVRKLEQTHCVQVLDSSEKTAGAAEAAGSAGRHEADCDRLTGTGV